MFMSPADHRPAMRQARVLSFALDPPMEATDRVETNLGLVLDLLDEAANYDPDFVCFPEFVLQLRYAGDGLSRREVAQPIPGPATDAVAERAADLGSYVWLPMIERDGDALHNAVALIGPDGEVRGRSRKFAPTIREMDGGVRPGTEVATWDTEFGRVGALICWDARYPELGARFAQRGVDLLFHPTTAKSTRRFESWAGYYGYHVVLCDKHQAKVVSPATGIVAPTSTNPGNPSIEFDGGGDARVSFARVNTDCGSYGSYQNREKTDAVRERYGGAVAFHELPDVGTVVIESIDDSVSIADLEGEFDLEPMFAYEDRTRDRVHEAIEGSPLLAPRDPD